MEIEKDIYILWISCFFHDSSVALLKNWEIIFAIEEEKLTRKKHDSCFPHKSIQACLNYCDISIKDIAYVGFYEKPFIKFENFLKNAVYTWPWGYYGFVKGIKEWLKYKLFFEFIFRKRWKYRWEIIYLEHHLSHAAGAFFSSGFEKSAFLTIDGVWESATTTWWVWENTTLKVEEEIHFPNSLGLLYSTFTAYLGFEVNEWEYKMMGLAPYWEPKYQSLIETHLVSQNPDGSYTLDMQYFDFQYWKKMFNEKFEALFWEKWRTSWVPLTQFHKDVASSIQKVTEKMIFEIVEYIYGKTKLDSLCISWWVALNCVANAYILQQSHFKHIYVQPSPGDSWTSIGCCYYIYSSILGKKSSTFSHIYLWEEFSREQIREALSAFWEKIVYEEKDFSEIVERVASSIFSKNTIVWWFQWRSEFWPRALWNRSILWNPLEKDNWQRINLKIKFRESFRPFAPSITQESLQKFYDGMWEFPYMLFVLKTLSPSSLSAVTHIDGTARVQTVTREQNERYFSLLKEFEKHTGVPILINTSFNLSWEPIVYSPTDALTTFLTCDMDILVLGNFLVYKK